MSMLKDIKNIEPDRLSQEELLNTRSAILKEIENRKNKTRGSESTEEGIISSKELVEKLRTIEKVIYGVDDRNEAYEITNAQIKDGINSVVALIRSDNISDNGDGKVFFVSKLTFFSQNPVLIILIC